MNATLSRRWLATLTVILAAMYAAIGLAGQGLVRPSGLLGAAAILACVGLARRARPLAITLLLLGVTPLVALTWWSIATPVIAIACLTLGWPRFTGSMLASGEHAAAGRLPT
ncbi:MAG: hypothetical protein ACOH2F_01300 [Cellulomonas sp.]